jgi:hypothetical protein
VTLDEAKTRVSIFLDDLQFGYHTESQVTAYINDAVRETQKYLVLAGQNWYTKCKQASLVSGSCEYYLPDDFLKLNRLEMVTGISGGVDTTYSLNPITLNQQELYSQSSSKPLAYVIVKNRLKLFPVPNVTNTIKLTYTYRIADLVLDTESLDVPEEYTEFVTLLAYKTGALRDDRSTAQIDGKIAMYLTSLKQSSNEREQQKPRYIRETGVDGQGSGWY